MPAVLWLDPRTEFGRIVEALFKEVEFKALVHVEIKPHVDKPPRTP